MKLADFYNARLGGYIDIGGLLTGIDGGYFETRVDVVMAMLGFCGCGDPQASLDFIKVVLTAIDNRTSLDLHAVYTDGVMYTMYYLLDNKKLTEHGSSVPGWLTDKGKFVRDALMDIDTQDVEV